MFGKRSKPKGANSIVQDENLKLVVLIRHAKAASFSQSGDFGRPLHRDGRAAARALGAWLVAQGVRPDIAVVSPATRTVQTWEELVRSGVHADDLWADAAIYDGEASDLIESLRAMPEDARVVALVGHMPAIPDLAAALADHLPAGSQHPHDGWPPASMSVVAHRGTWLDFPGPETAMVAFRRG